MKDLTTSLNESIENINEASKETSASKKLLKEILSKGSVKCEVKYRTYNRGYNEQNKAATFKVNNIWELCFVLACKLGLYLWPDEFIDEDESYTLTTNDAAEIEEKGHAAFNSIAEANGDGCDYIYYLKMGNEVLIDDKEFFDEEDW